MSKLMSFGRAEAAASLRDAIQKAADAAKLGVEIVFVGLQDIHPPTGTKEIAVAAAYEKLIGSEQERATTVHAAEGEAKRNVISASADATRIVNDAKSTAVRRESDATGRAGRFASQVLAYHAAPSVYRTSAQVETFTKAVADARKYVVVPPKLSSVISLNLEDKLRKDFLDAALVNPDKPAEKK
jgi:regulator of protease activity HflC (stomatin/prohibitin superfamily)